MKHTKGKWTAKKNSLYFDITSVNEETRMTASIHLWKNNDSLDDLHHTDENAANAKLISKAPEMYEALKNLPIHRLPLLDTTKEKIDSLLKQLES
jgi:hypothetical protein